MFYLFNFTITYLFTNWDFDDFAVLVMGGG